MNVSPPKDIAALLQEERRYDVVPPQVLASMSGLAFMQAMLDGKLPAPPITRTMNFLITKVEKGYARAEAIPSFDFYNPIGSVHGGYAATLLDTVLGCSVHTTLEQGQGYTTLEFKVSLVKAITKDTGPIQAEGRVMTAGRRVATAEAHLRDASGRLLAHGTTTCLVFDLPTGSAPGKG
ncbi:PaaI family thioesterase [Afipia sp. P52-10]|uniref:PaaI family thioesterase n=1 Tax=Afipia sp. P52-10 TaxID=1429916 RepID=UPI0004B914A3|nr:PaaI family thioesterase [Afipia sp. P52-10]